MMHNDGKWKVQVLVWKYIYSLQNQRKWQENFNRNAKPHSKEYSLCIMREGERVKNPIGFVKKKKWLMNELGPLVVSGNHMSFLTWKSLG